MEPNVKRLALAATVLLSLAGAASAADYRREARCVNAREIDAMRAREMHRIEEGRRSGQLSWREYQVLKAEQARISADERFAKIDDCVSPTEFHRIELELARASQHIRQLKTNDEIASRRHWRWWY